MAIDKTPNPTAAGDLPPRVWRIPSGHFVDNIIPDEGDIPYVLESSVQELVRQARAEAFEEAEKAAIKVSLSKNNAGRPEAIGSCCALAMTFSEWAKAARAQPAPTKNKEEGQE